MPRSSSNRVLASLSTNDFDLRAFVFHAWRPAARRDCGPLRQAIPGSNFRLRHLSVLGGLGAALFKRRRFDLQTRMLLARLA